MDPAFPGTPGDAPKNRRNAMQRDRYKVLTESIRRLLRRNADSYLKKIVRKTHAADLARVFPHLTVPQQKKLFDYVENADNQGILFAELHATDSQAFEQFIEDMPEEAVALVLEAMPSDDVADILGALPDEKADAILKKMKLEGSEEVEELLRYQDDTAGGIMTPDFIALTEDTTAREAIVSLQEEHQDVEMPFYLYVVDGYDKLVGVCSLRGLVVVPPDTPLKDFMSTEVFSVRTDMDQEEVAKLVARYDILAVPVVTEMNELVGIVTVDDVIDIFRQEATEDILKMAGAGAEFVETKSVLRSVRIRLPWLFASFLGGIAAVFIIGQFEDSLKKIASLAAFIPVIMGMGGNIGTQSSTIVVRGLSTGLLDARQIWAVVSKELAVGVLLGVFYGMLLGLVAQFQHTVLTLSFCVGAAVLGSMGLAALVGSLVPMVFARLHIDPAVATGPFVTTTIDILSVFFYFQLSTMLLKL